MKLSTVSGQPATVFVQGRELGTTGEELTFDITEYRRPLYLDIVLKRPGKVPTLHTLEVRDTNGVWEPPPLKVLGPSQEVRLRVDPEPQKIEREDKNGNREPAGTGAYLTLETGNLALGQPFRAHPVVVHLEREGYVSTRLELPPEVWFADVYPPPAQEPFQLLKAPGWQAWWVRNAKDRPYQFLSLIVLVAAALFALRLRYHYLRKIEAAHQSLSLWVERLDTLVAGSRELAFPLTIEELSECTLLQARRLCRSEWEAVHSVDPEFTHSTAEEQFKNLAELSKFMRKKQAPIRTGSLGETRFKDYVKDGNSLLIQPLIFKREYYGMLVLGCTAEDAFSETDQEALGVLASQTAAAVERIRLHAETVEAYDKLKESELQLVQSAKMAAVGQLAAGVAHELNTPLNAISFGVEVAETSIKTNPDRAEKRLVLVKNATKRAAEIVRKLLYYSREARLEDQEFDLEQMLVDTADFIRFQLDQDGLELVLPESEKIPLRGNLSELSQVITNLILNARDASLKKDGASQIEVTVDLSGNSVRISILDHGPGVPKDLQDKIFDPFFTTKNLGDGTGLGLSISRKIAEKHGGRLFLESAADPCCFILEVPLRGQVLGTSERTPESDE